MSLLKLLRSENGFAAYIALGIISIMMVIGAGLITVADNELSSARHISDRNKAYYLAEAGINHALWELNQETAGDGKIFPPVGLNGGTYETAYSGKTLTSTGVFNNVTRKIIVNVTESIASSAFDVGVFGGQFSAIPEKVIIWNGLGSTEPDRVVIENYGENMLQIKGKVLNYPEIDYNPTDGKTHEGGSACTTTPKRHASAYGVKPNGEPAVSYVGSSAEGRIATTSTGFSPPRFNPIPDDTKIAAANPSPSLPVNGIWNTDKELSAGPIYISGDLEIKSDAEITTNLSVTKSTPAEVIVWGNVYIDNATIGNATGDSYIRILAHGNIKFNSKDYGLSHDTYLKKETQFYSQSNVFVYDNVTMDQASIYSKGTLDVESSHNLDINLKGILFSMATGGIGFRAEGSSSGTIEFNGGMVAGYKEDNGTVHNGQIHLHTNSQSPEKAIQLTFSQAAKPSELPSAFSVTSGAQLDYTTWREQ